MFVASLLNIVSLLLVIKTTNGLQTPDIKISFPDAADKDFQDSFTSIMTNSNPIFQLICTASYPIEWIFHYSTNDDGISELLKFAETHREAEMFEDSSTYFYSAKLRLEYKGQLSSLTNFTCRNTNIQSKASYETHVIMSSDEQNRLITLNIADKMDSRTESFSEEKHCYKSVALLKRSKENLPCWRCQRIDGYELELDYADCISPIECNSIYARIPHDETCRKEVDQKIAKCKQSNSGFTGKIVLCKDYGPALQQFHFFGIYRGDSLGDESIPLPPMYLGWNEVNTSEMIYLHETPQIIYLHEEVTFTCEYSRYYFSLGSWFGIWSESNNKTTHFKGLDFRPCNIKFEQPENHNCSLNEDWRGTFRANFTTSLSETGKHEIFCFGPVWNTTEWANVSRTFMVKQGKRPKVLSVGPRDTSGFVVGQQHRMLVCAFEGEPTPQVTWIAPNNESNFRTVNISKFKSAIDFYEVGYQTSGEYSCVVSSYLGSDKKSYHLSPSSISTGAITAISLTVVAVVVVVVLIVLRMFGIIKSQQKALRLLTEAEIDEFVRGNPRLLQEKKDTEYFDNSTRIDALPYDEKYEISEEKLHIDHAIVLGSGEFGIVLRGYVDVTPTLHYVNISQNPNSNDYMAPDSNDKIPVAVKVSKGNLNVDNFKALLTEIKVMAYLGSHINIVTLVGASTQNIRRRELFIAVEFCQNGSMDKYLKRNKEVFVSSYCRSDNEFTLWNLLKWTCEIADGLAFIHEKKVIHADLALRNILLDGVLNAKIGDFGLSRQLIDSANYTKTTHCALPWRNMAIESLRGLEFSVKSDIWSFGVTLWELFTFADVPYPGLNYTVDFVSLLTQGLRLYRPPNAPNQLYDYMLLCWSNEPADRPTTSEVKAVCEKLMTLQ